jgi:ABC-type nitrate/sulfonate/bicarbonate transport system permease component
LNAAAAHSFRPGELAGVPFDEGFGVRRDVEVLVDFAHRVPLVALYSIPKITLYPLILLLFGLAISAKIAFGALHGIIPVIIFSMNAVRNLRPVLLRSARAIRLTPRRCPAAC